MVERVRAVVVARVRAMVVERVGGGVVERVGMMVVAGVGSTVVARVCLGLGRAAVAWRRAQRIWWCGVRGSGGRRRCGRRGETG